MQIDGCGGIAGIDVGRGAPGRPSAAAARKPAWSADTSPATRDLIKPVLTGLPRVLRVNLRSDKSGEWFENTLRHAVEQAAAARPGSAVFLAHLAEALFADVLRRYLSSLPEGRTGWLAGSGDPAVGRALAALHRRPSHDWSLDELAREVGVSRSVLTERFTRYLGVAPDELSHRLATGARR